MDLSPTHGHPGVRVLEIGSGGYNAELVGELVGERGQVTTVDIDPDVTERARASRSPGPRPDETRPGVGSAFTNVAVRTLDTAAGDQPSRYRNDGFGCMRKSWCEMFQA